MNLACVSRVYGSAERSRCTALERSSRVVAFSLVALIYFACFTFSLEVMLTTAAVCKPLPYRHLRILRIRVAKYSPRVPGGFHSHRATAAAMCACVVAPALPPSFTSTISTTLTPNIKIFADLKKEPGNSLDRQVNPLQGP